MGAEPVAEMVPAVAVNPAVVEPASTVTEADTGSSELLLDSPTTAPPLGAAPESVTVQEVDCAEPRLVGLHASLVNVGAGGTSWMVAVCDVLLRSEERRVGKEGRS